MYTHAFLKSIDYTENSVILVVMRHNLCFRYFIRRFMGEVNCLKSEKKKGISLVLCQRKGEELLKSQMWELFDADITRAIQLNHQLEYPSRIPSSRVFFFEKLRKGV